MEPLIPFAAALVGFVLGALAFSRVGHWLVGIHGVFQTKGEPKPHGVGPALVSAVLLASGPWLLVALGILASAVSGTAWAPWLFGGFGAAAATFGGITIYLARKSSRSQGAA